jgi:hypothetical protein
MATYLRETLEGRLVERVESGGLELAARAARARRRLTQLAERSTDDPPADE